MGWLSKTWKRIKKPVVGGTLGFLASGLNPLGAALGAVAGFQQGEAERSADKAAAAAQANAERQEMLAAAAPTTLQAPSVTTEHLDASLESAAGDRRRRYGLNKTVNAGKELRRYTGSLRKTLG